MFDSRDKYTQWDGGIKEKNKTLQHPMNHFKRCLFFSKVEQTVYQIIYNPVVSRVFPVCDTPALLTLMEQTYTDTNKDTNT